MNILLLVLSPPFVKSPYVLVGLLSARLTRFSLQCSAWKVPIVCAFITLLLDYRSWSSENASEPGVGQAGAVFPHGEVPIFSLSSINPDT